MSTLSFDADAVIVGSGAAGANVACRLARAGARVIVLEGGPNVTRADLHARFLKTKVYTPVDLDPRVEYAPTTHPDTPDSYLINTGDEPYNLNMSKMVGGTTWHWAGRCHRMLDAEFKMRSIYGVGVDWPFDYGELEPWYSDAEYEFGVSGPGDNISSSRRSRPLPMSDFAWPYFYKKLKAVLAPHGYDLFTANYARNTKVYDGRPACKGNNNCWPLCPIGAQYNAIVHVDKARELGVEVRPQSLVVHLETDAGGRISRAVYRRPDGTLGNVRARIFVLAANGLETPKTLLASRSEAAPDGLANSSGQVGRNLMDHPSVSTQLVSRAPLYPGRGPIVFGELHGPEAGEFRRLRAAAILSIQNRLNVDDITFTALRQGLTGDALDERIRFLATRSFTIASDVEMLPDPDNRIKLDWNRRDSAGQPRMQIRFNLDDYTRQTIEQMAETHLDIGAKAEVVKSETKQAFYHGSHPMGATRMGDDPRTSVVDRDCRCHDHPNLFISSSAVFPSSSGPYSPTLTIVALALKTAGAIVTQLKQQ